VEALLDCFSIIDRNNEQLLLNILKCFERLLRLDDSLAFTANDEPGFCFHFKKMDGVEQLEQLLLSQSTQVI